MRGAASAVSRAACPEPERPGYPTTSAVDCQSPFAARARLAHDRPAQARPGAPAPSNSGLNRRRRPIRFLSLQRIAFVIEKNTTLPRACEDAGVDVLDGSDGGFSGPQQERQRRSPAGPPNVGCSGLARRIQVARHIAYDDGTTRASAAIDFGGRPLPASHHQSHVDAQRGGLVSAPELVRFRSRSEPRLRRFPNFPAYDGSEIAILPIEEKLPPTRIMSVRLKQNALRPAVEAFAAFLREAFAPGGAFAPGSITALRVGAVKRL